MTAWLVYRHGICLCVVRVPASTPAEAVRRGLILGGYPDDIKVARRHGGES